MTTRNILKIYRSASPEQVEAGMTWYFRAHDLAVELAGDSAIGAGVIAALSPNCSWDQNVVMARRAFDTGVVSGTFGDAERKAQAILDGGDPREILGGRKVRSFFENIVDPSNPVPVTVDRHSYDLSMGARSQNDKRPAIGKRKYAELTEYHYRAAKIMGVMPHQIQAVTWERWRQMWAWRKTAAA